MKTITVFTPTFNRAHLLPRLYESLCRQTSSDFLWMVIDDGSTDDTKTLIEQWKAEGLITIAYYYKENGGMHTGHNLAYQEITTELNVCIDSDDYMPDNAIENILTLWAKVPDKTKIAGIIGLDATAEGQVIGTPIPDTLKRGNLIDLYKKHNVKGDKKLVVRTDVVREYPSYPEYESEKLVPLGILYLMIGVDYDFVYSNEVYCIVEYQEGGSSATIFKQYFQSPRGFAYARRIQKKYSMGLKDDIKNSIHIGLSSLVTRDFSLLKQGVKSFYNFLLFPIAIVFYLYLKRKI